MKRFVMVGRQLRAKLARSGRLASIAGFALINAHPFPPRNNTELVASARCVLILHVGPSLKLEFTLGMDATIGGAPQFCSLTLRFCVIMEMATSWGRVRVFLFLYNVAWHMVLGRLLRRAHLDSVQL